MVETKNDLRAFLADLFRIAVETAHPAAFLPALLPAVSKGRVIVLAAGKAAGSMAEVAENFYLDEANLSTNRLTGIAVARHGYDAAEAGRPLCVPGLANKMLVALAKIIPDGLGLSLMHALRKHG